MNRPPCRLFKSLIILMSAALPALAQAQTADIPASFHGTYSLTFETEHPEAPLPDGAPAELVLGPGGALCIADYILTDPQLTDGEPAAAVWTAADVGVQLAISADGAGSVSEVDVLALDGSSLGLFTGSKTSDSTACGSIDEMPQNIGDIDDVFSLAEQAYADLFPTDISDASLRVLDGFIYRHYVASGIHVGINVSDNNVYLLGGDFGSEPANVGSVSSVLSQLYTALGMEPPDDEGGPIDVPEGDFTLTVTGSASGSLQGDPFNQEFNDPPLLVVESIGAPDVNDVEAMEDQLVTQLEEANEELESGAVSNVEIGEIEVDENRVFFNVKFDSEMEINGSDATISFDLDYEFLRN